MAGYVNVMSLIVLGTVLMCPPLSYLMQKFVLPKPGEGPSEAEMDKGFLRVTGHGTGSQGGKVRASLYFPTDPGYRDTARYAQTIFDSFLWINCCLKENIIHMENYFLLSIYAFSSFLHIFYRMLVESGLVLALQSKEIKVGGGLYTPAACQGELLLQRLIDSGSSFYIE